MKRLALASSALLVFGLAPASAETIVVAPGDSLSRIAARHLGDAGRWPELCEANSAALDGDCDLLPVGTGIVVPEAAAEAATAAPETVPEPAPVESVATPEAAPAEPVAAAEPAPAAASVELTDLLVRQMSVENLTVTAGEEFEGQRTSVLTTMPGAGAGRVAYLIEIGEAPRVQVSWSMRAEEPDPLSVLLYSGSRGGTYATIEFDAASAVSTTGEVENAVVTRAGDWLTLTFAFAVGAEQTTSQLLIYPAGISTAASQELALTVAPPIAKGEVAP